MKSLFQNKNQKYFLIIILIIGAALRFYHIDFQSVWLDEIHTLNEANPNLSWAQFYQALLASDPHPPLYFALIRSLFYFFGYKTLVLRLFSALLGVLGIYAIYLLGKEMRNKETGLIAAFLLSINSFHLYYSQDGRPYIFLVLFCIFAFYRLLIFLKEPNLKHALYYGIFAGFMIESHFFGLFALFAQYVILLIVLLTLDKKKRLIFFFYSALSAFVSLLLFLPALSLFFKSMAISNFWIPAPKADFLISLFQAFFGDFFLLWLIVIPILGFYFVELFKEIKLSYRTNNLIKNKTILNALILWSWIILVILIPLIRSYLSVPMMINRYFIVILPAVILLISEGISFLSKKWILQALVALFFILSLFNIFILKDYYNRINKAQFRESTQFIIQNNKDNSPVISRLAWYMPFFLKNDSVNYTIIGRSLNDYLDGLRKDSSKIKPFWYIDGFGSDYQPSPVNQKFLTTNFYIDNNFDGFQAWAKHFILAKGVDKRIDMSRFAPLKRRCGDSFLFNIESFLHNKHQIELKGWAYFDKQSAKNTSIKILLIKEGELIGRRLASQKVIRKDVTTFFKSNFDLSNSGFKVKDSLEDFLPGSYVLAIYLSNEKTNKEGLLLSKFKIII